MHHINDDKVDIYVNEASLMKLINIHNKYRNKSILLFFEMKIHIRYLINRFEIVKSNLNEPKLNLGINLRSDNDIYLQVESL